MNTSSIICAYSINIINYWYNYIFIWCLFSNMFDVNRMFTLNIFQNVEGKSLCRFVRNWFQKFFLKARNNNEFRQNANNNPPPELSCDFWIALRQIQDLFLVGSFDLFFLCVSVCVNLKSPIHPILCWIYSIAVFLLQHFMAQS